MIPIVASWSGEWNNGAALKGPQHPSHNSLLFVTLKGYLSFSIALNCFDEFLKDTGHFYPSIPSTHFTAHYDGMFLKSSFYTQYETSPKLTRFVRWIHINPRGGTSPLLPGKLEPFPRAIIQKIYWILNKECLSGWRPCHSSWASSPLSVKKESLRNCK